MKIIKRKKNFFFFVRFSVTFTRFTTGKPKIKKFQLTLSRTHERHIRTYGGHTRAAVRR